MPANNRAKRSAAAAEVAEPDPSIPEANLAAPVKKRGRPPKNPVPATSTVTAPTTNDIAASAVAPKKATRRKPPKQSNPSDVAIESSNTGNSDAPITKDPQPPPAKRSKTQKSAPTASRDPLPSRARNSHPGTPDVPRPKRSTAEVKAVRKELEAIEAQRAQMEERKVQLYAELELEDEAAQEADARNVIRTLAQVREEEREEFSFSEIDAEESEEGEDVEKDEDNTKGTKGRPKRVVRKVCSC